MVDLPRVTFSEIAVRLEGAAAGARIAIGQTRATLLVDVDMEHFPGLAASLEDWRRDAITADELSALFLAMAPHEELVRDFLAGLLGEITQAAKPPVKLRREL